ncbi:MAG: hypothetical protein H6749_00140 [Nitrospiraceae bacterium]|nr:hypothetical protein [Nitrospiraceae bacterium]
MKWPGRERICGQSFYRRGGWLLLCLIFTPLLVGWEFLGFASHSWHQKMTVEVEVGDQRYAGSSVVEMNVFGHPEIPMVHGVRNLELEGEAVVVALPAHRYLFALLTYNAFLARDVFKDRIIEAVHAPGERWAGALSRLRETRVIDPKQYPLLVTFTDLTDPTTVKKVDPENLAATLGPGVSLKRITLEITDEPVTEGKIEQVLGWWLAQGTDRRDPPPFHAPNNSPRGYETIGITKFIMKSH